MTWTLARRSGQGWTSLSKSGADLPAKLICTVGGFSKRMASRVEEKPRSEQACRLIHSKEWRWITCAGCTLEQTRGIDDMIVKWDKRYSSGFLCIYSKIRLLETLKHIHQSLIEIRGNNNQDLWLQNRLTLLKTAGENSWEWRVSDHATGAGLSTMDQALD